MIRLSSGHWSFNAMILPHCSRPTRTTNSSKTPLLWRGTPACQCRPYKSYKGQNKVERKASHKSVFEGYVFDISMLYLRNWVEKKLDSTLISRNVIDVINGCPFNIPTLDLLELETILCPEDFTIGRVTWPPSVLSVDLHETLTRSENQFHQTFLCKANTVSAD